MAITRAVTNDYLSSTKSVIQAGRDLQKALKAGADAQKKNVVIKRLTEAGAKHDTGTRNFRALMFSEAETEATAPPAVAQATEQLFANMVNDLEVANVYIAAGQNLGETNEAPKPYLLDDALNRLNQTSSTLESFLTGAKVVDNGIVRYGFAEGDAPTPAPPAPDLKSAADSFQSDADSTLKLLVDDAEGVVTAVIDDLKKLVDKIGLNKLLEIFGGLGGPLGEVPKLIGNFIKLGIEKIRAVMKSIEDLLGSDLLSRISAQIVELYNDITGGGVISSLLRSLFDTENTSARIESILKLDGLDKDRVLRAANELGELHLPYQNYMVLAKKGVKAVGLAAAILLVIPVAGVKVAGFAAIAYGLILSLVVLIGMDYADSGNLLKRTRGVGEIAESLRP